MKKLLIISAAILTLYSSSLFAGLAITPSRAEIKAPQGERYSGKYNVRNDYPCPVDVSVEYKDWFINKENNGISIQQWFSIKTDPQFHLEAGESKDVEYEVVVPTQTKGSLVGMVSFVPHTAEQNGVTLVISASIYLTAVGTEIVSWDVKEIKISKFESNCQIFANIVNTGNIHLRPLGVINILGKKKAVVKTLQFTDGRPVYPGQERLISANANELAALKPGSYKAEFMINCAGELRKFYKKLKIKKSGEILIK